MEPEVHRRYSTLYDAVIEPIVAVELYDAWHAVEPDQGYDVKAAEWRAKQEGPDASSPPSTAP